MDEMNLPAEMAQHQQSLFSDPVSRYFEADFNLRTIENSLKEMEHDYPIELEELIEALKELQAQVKGAKEEFMQNLRQNNSDYTEMAGKKLHLSLDKEQASTEIKAMAKVHTASNELDLEIVGRDGVTYKLQTLKNTDVFINGKHLK